MPRLRHRASKPTAKKAPVRAISPAPPKAVMASTRPLKKAGTRRPHVK
jgi:hypothetical protein